MLSPLALRRSAPEVIPAEAGIHRVGYGPRGDMFEGKVARALAVLPWRIERSLGEARARR
jgi:hypothetical protein